MVPTDLVTDPPSTRLAHLLNSRPRQRAPLADRACWLLRVAEVLAALNLPGEADLAWSHATGLLHGAISEVAGSERS